MKFPFPVEITMHPCWPGTTKEQAYKLMNRIQDKIRMSDLSDNIFANVIRNSNEYGDLYYSVLVCVEPMTEIPGFLFDINFDGFTMKGVL